MEIVFDFQSENIKEKTVIGVLKKVFPEPI
jgi:hypothetical protein